eukprot:TRINITY_DN5442_c0_g1_i1.p2 TRINITY_DN5442_c0_g1~~TRINITY_DN5442_c0_g1_i1.p2  ORF type:complete len:516 (-),score=123.97 TRINITY_DN5442_c0_g1_i1:294-1841(-)
MRRSLDEGPNVRASLTDVDNRSFVLNVPSVPREPETSCTPRTRLVGRKVVAYSPRKTLALQQRPPQRHAPKFTCRKLTFPAPGWWEVGSADTSARGSGAGSSAQASAADSLASQVGSLLNDLSPGGFSMLSSSSASEGRTPNDEAAALSDANSSSADDCEGAEASGQRGSRSEEDAVDAVVAMTGKQLKMTCTKGNLFGSPKNKGADLKRQRSRMKNMEKNGMSEEDANKHKETLRRAMIKYSGSAKKAFQCIDLNGSGSASLQEFVDGLRRMRVKWQELTGLKTERDLILLFDRDRDGTIAIAEMFPEVYRKKEGPERMDTPEFWNDWCKNNKDLDPSLSFPEAQWHYANLQERMTAHSDANEVREEAANRRRWISSHYRLLRKDGKSNRQCRQWIAHHLPGATTSARAQVEAFNGGELTERGALAAAQEATAYQEQVMAPVRNVATAVASMREQRRDFAATRKLLFSVVLEPLVKAEEEAEMQRVAQEALHGLRSMGRHGQVSTDEGATEKTT